MMMTIGFFCCILSSYMLFYLFFQFDNINNFVALTIGNTAGYWGVFFLIKTLKKINCKKTT